MKKVSELDCNTIDSCFTEQSEGNLYLDDLVSSINENAKKLAGVQPQKTKEQNEVNENKESNEVLKDNELINKLNSLAQDINDIHSVANKFIYNEENEDIRNSLPEKILDAFERCLYSYDKIYIL